MQLPLNALQAFEVSARFLSFTRAAQEMSVTQAAVSQQVKNLEERLGVPLFRRLPRGLALTDEGAALLPVLTQSFARIDEAVGRLKQVRPREVLTVGAVGTFATGWLIPRLKEFQERHSFVDLRLLTNNNRVDLAGEGLDFAIRFGDGAWHGTEALLLFAAPLSPVCTPGIAAQLRSPADLAGQLLLRSYRFDEWATWFEAAGARQPVIHGTVFDSSLTMAHAAAQGAGVALLPVRMFERELREGVLVRPFAAEVNRGSYWLTRLKSRAETAAMVCFREWLQAQASTGSARTVVLDRSP
ncbi:MAG: LysR family transcriptional regulator [Burkholderiaceae bacterium]